MSGTTNDVGRMLIRIEATTAALRGQLSQAEGQISQFTRSIEQKLGGFERMFQSVGQNALRSITGIAAGVVAVNSVAQALGNMVTTADQAAQAATRIGSALGSMQAGRQIFDQISASAQRTGTSASDAVDSFLRFSIATRQIGGTNAQALQLVDMLQKMAVVSGAAGQAGGAAMTQLGQALASGRLQGDELRSILENMPTLAEGLANQLGVSVGMLRQMGTEGKLTSETVFAALLRMAPEINRQFEQMPVSVERATNSLAQAWNNLTTQLDRATGITARIAAATQGAADRVQRLAENLVPKTAADELREVNAQIERMLRLQREAGEAAVRNQANRGSIGTGAANSAAGVYGTAGMEEQLRLLREQAVELQARADAEKASADAAAAAEAAQAALRAEENARQQVLERLKDVQEALGGANDKTREQMDALRTVVAAGDDAMRRYGISAQTAAGMLAALETKADGVRRVVADLNAQTAQIAAGGVAGRIQAALRQAAPGGNADLLDQNQRDQITAAETARSQAQIDQRIREARAEAQLAQARRNGQEAGERLARVNQQVAEAAREGATEAQQAALRTELLSAAQDRNAAAGQTQLQSVAKVRQELTLAATAAERAADAATRGAAAERRADQASKARAQALKVARDGTEAYNAAYREFLALVQREDRGEARQDIAHRSDALRNEIALIQRETDLIGALPGQREAEIAALRVRQELIASGKSYTEDEIKAVEELARQRARVGQIQRQVEEQLQQVRQVSSEIARDVSTAIFESLTDKDKASSVLDWFKSLFKRIAIAALQANVVLPITQQIVGAMPGLFGATGSGGAGVSIAGLSLGGGSGSGARIVDAQGNVIGQIGNTASVGTIGRGIFGGGLGSFFPGGMPLNTGWGFADNLLNTPLFTSPLQQGPVAAGFSLPSVTAAQVLGPALSVGGGIYGAINGFQTGGLGGTIQGIGGIASAATGGAMLASSAGLLPALGALGPAGLIAGAVASIVGSLIGGPKPSGKGQEFRVDLLSGATDRNGLTGSRYSAENAAQAENAARQVANLATQLSTALGGARIPGEAAVGVTSGRGDGDTGQLYLEVSGRKAQFANTDEGAQQLADQAAAYLLEAFRGAVSGDFAGILNASPDVATLQQNLDWYQNTYKALTDTAEASSAFAQSLQQVRDQWQPAIDKANELSLATGELTRKRDEEIAKLQQQRDLQVSGLYQQLNLREAAANGNSPYGTLAQLLQSNLFVARANEIETFRKQLEDLGVSTSEVTAQVARLTQVQGAEYWKNFADVMAANDADTIDRIRRATGQGDAADLAAFDRDAKATLDQLRQTLAQFAELTVEQVNEKILQKEQALAIQRQALVDQQILAAQEAAEQQAAMIQQAGQRIRSYLDSLATKTGPGGVSPQNAFTAAQSQFERDLQMSRGNDPDALARITGTADTLLEAAQRMYASGPQYQAIREWVTSSLSQLPATLSYDAQQLDQLKKIREEIEKLNKANQTPLDGGGGGGGGLGASWGGLSNFTSSKLTPAELAAKLAAEQDKAEKEYLAANLDVAAAVASGVFKSGYDHWVRYGQYEDTRSVWGLNPVLQDQQNAVRNNLNILYAVGNNGQSYGNSNNEALQAEVYRVSTYYQNNPDVFDAYQNGLMPGMSAIEFAEWHYKTYGANEGRKFAAGGIVTGGIPGVDSVSAMLMPGEGVLSLRGMAALDNLNSGGLGGNQEVRSLREEVKGLRRDLSAALERLTRVTVGVGEESLAQGGEMVRHLKDQASARLLDGASPNRRAA